MRILAHLSDMHFGSIAPYTLAPLIRAVRDAAPDMVVVSGDLTQRARAKQFREARHFLSQLPLPQVVVPGNHDIPLFNLFGRFLWPLNNYRRYITKDLEPFYLDTEIAVMGINTARSVAFKNGRISTEQIERIRKKFCLLDERLFKVLVTHHPLDFPNDRAGEWIVGRAKLAMEALASCGADLLLAGHAHFSGSGNTSGRYPISGYTALFVHAGTATSSRGRGEVNAFNVIQIERPFVNVYRHTWRGESDSFHLTWQEGFEQTEKGWVRLESGLP